MKAQQCEWRVNRQLAGGNTIQNVIDIIHMPPGTIVNYSYRLYECDYYKKTETKVVKVLKEFPLYFLVDFGNYLGTIHKKDILIGMAKISMKWGEHRWH